MSRPFGSGFAVSKSIKASAASIGSDFLYPTAFMAVLRCVRGLQKGICSASFLIASRLARLAPLQKTPEQSVLLRQMADRAWNATRARSMSAFGLSLDQHTDRSTVPIDRSDC